MRPGSSGEEKGALVPPENVPSRETGGTPVSSVFFIFLFVNYIMNPEQGLGK